MDDNSAIALVRAFDPKSIGGSNSISGVARMSWADVLGPQVPRIPQPEKGVNTLAFAKSATAIAVAAVVVSVAPFAGAATARVPAQWKNCTQVNKRFPHGVGRVSARDKTSG